MKATYLQRRAPSLACLRLVAVLVFLSFRPAGGAGAEMPASPANSAAPAPRARKLRVFDRELAESLASQGARRIADYGGFQIIEVPQGHAAAIPAGAKAQPADEFDFIELHAQRLDTKSPETVALRQSVPAFRGKRLHLVQFAGPVKPEWRQSVEEFGLRIAAFIPHNAYLVYGDSTALSRMRAWSANKDFVQWEGSYLDSYKTHPNARLVDDKGRPRALAGNLFSIQLVDDPEPNAATLALIDQIKLEPPRRQSRLLGYLNLVVRLPPERLADLAASPELVSIQAYDEPRKLDERQDQILAGNLSGNIPVLGPGYLAWLAGKGFTQAQFTASGFVVDLSDSGIDNGTTSPNHFALYTGGETLSPSRVVYNRLAGTANGRSGVACSPALGQNGQYGFVSTLQGWDGHGTLNSHIIGGYDDWSVGFPHTDSGGFNYGLGVCPFVNIGSSVIFDPYNFTSPDYTTLQTKAYNSGARLSSNSWGGSTNGLYDVDAQSFDALVRDVGASGGNRPMVIVFAAGNAGPGAVTISTPGSAKNVITVGAAANVRSMSPASGGNDPAGNDGCQTDDTAAASANDVGSYSSVGPCADGRMKPDLMAPGSHVTGGAPQSSPAPDPLATDGSGLACFDGSGVCALTGSGADGSTNNFFPLGQEFFTVSTGTSHATPAVTGACALLRQYFINHGSIPPSPAMTKAYLMNSARYLTGSGAADTLWSASQGMGEVNLGASFDGAGRILHDQLPADTFTSAGQQRTFTGSIADPSKPFRVTLAWTDAPGSTTGAAYNNDLDLTVTVGGVTYLGNVFNGQFSTAGGAADAKDNVESVFLAAGFSGSFTVTVTAANIASDALSAVGSTPRQDFALVIYNGSQAPNLAMGQTVSPSSIDIGATATFTIGVTNLGSVALPSVTVTDTLPAGLGYLSATPSQGSVAVNNGLVTATLGSLASGASATLTLQASGLSAGSWVNTASVPAAGATTTATVTVNPPPAISAIPNVTVNQNTVAGPIQFAVSDSLVSASALTLSAASSNPTLLPVANITFGGAGGARTITMTPVAGQSGSSTVTVTVSDGFTSAATTFSLIVNATSPALTLAPVSNQTIYASTTLLVTNTVLNPGGSSPSFRLGQGAPAGAVVNPASGVFSWTPGAAYSGSTNPVQVIATSASTPPVSATNNFLVTVLAGPLLQPALLPNNNLVLTWKALAGFTYRLQVSGSLGAPNWVNLTPDIIATGPAAAATNQVGPGQQYYRLLIPPQ